MEDHKLNLPNANVYIIHNYFANAEQTFEYLRDHLNWVSNDHLPDNAICNMGNDYSTGQFHEGQAFDPMVADIMDALNRTFNVMMNACYAVLYKNGNAALPYRTNVEADFDINQPLFSISFGSPRNITFKDNASGQEYEFLLVAGDLLIMSDNFQQNYSYAIKPSTQYTEQRISLNFRHFLDISMKPLI